MNVATLSNAPIQQGHDLVACPTERLEGELNLPGDKSVSHRALVIASLASGISEIHGLLHSEDVLATAGALQRFGIDVRFTGDSWKVRGGPWRNPAGSIHCGNSGTSARLLMGAMAPFKIRAEFTGDASLCQRPMERVLAPLQRMGLRLETRDACRLPFVLRGGPLHGITHINCKSSAQVKSAILLAGLQANGPTHVAEPIESRDHTERMLRYFGCEVVSARYDGKHLVGLGNRRTLHASRLEVPGDPSSAAFPLVAGLITRGSRVTVCGMMSNPLRTAYLNTLEDMGAKLRGIDRGSAGAESIADVTASSSALSGVRVPALHAPRLIDEYPILAVAAAFARGVTAFEGVGELRVKECDRILAIVQGLTACGVRCKVEGDDLLIRGTGGKVPGGCTVRSHGDHRIAMAFLVLGLGARDEVRIDDARMIATSFPGFAATMRRIGASIG